MAQFPPKSVLQALVRIDPEDQRLLPILEDYRRHHEYSDDGQEGDREADPLGWLINRLRERSQN